MSSHPELSPAQSARNPRALMLPVVVTAILATLAWASIQWGVAVAPLFVAAVVLFMFRLPSAVRARAFLYMVLVADVPSDHPASGMWESPLYSLGTVLFENLRKSTGIEFLHVSGLDLMLVALVIAGFLGGHRRRAGDAPPAASCMRWALVADLIALASLDVLGLLTGGDFQQSLWQIRPLAYVPLATIVLLESTRVREDIALLGRVVVAAALTKCVLGLYFYFVICRPAGVFPRFITSHSDSALFGAAILLICLRCLEEPTPQTVLRAALFVPVIALTTALNNRRLAYVSIAAAAAAAYAAMPRTRVKRTLMRFSLIAVPMLAIYVAVGWHSNHLIFAPVHSFETMSSPGEDRSAAMRDIEDYNLIETLRRNPLLGAGFGHPYDELVKGDDISKGFPQYRFIAHNDVLCLWMLGGLFGFTAVWLPIMVGIFLAVRAYRLARLPALRALSLASAGWVVIYAVQGWGDMGFHTWAGVFVLAVALAVAGKMSTAVGAWPSRLQTQATFPEMANLGTARVPT